MKRLQSAWQSYRDAVIPKGASSTQIVECRRAFYAGAQSFYGTLMSSLEPGTEGTDNDLSLMEGLDAELREFNEQVKQGIS